MRQAVVAQEVHWMTAQSYTARTDSLRFAMPPGTTFRVHEVTRRGWRGVGIVTASGYTCGMFVGLPVPAACPGLPEALLDPRAMGFTITAFVEVFIEHPRHEGQFIERALALDEVLDRLRERLEGAGLLSYRVLWFERDGEGFRPPRDWPALAAACSLRRRSASIARMPPSPLLSARRMKTMYLTLTTRISDQRISDSTPYTVAGSARRPYSGLLKASLMV